MVSYSSASKNYNGTYSAQRQELVEQWGAYGVLCSEFIGQCVRPVWESFVSAAVLAGAVSVPRGSDVRDFAEAVYIAPSMPWIDPVKEATANEILEKNCLVSGPELIRRRGGNPDDVLKQEAMWRSRKLAQLPANDAESPTAVTINEVTTA